MTSENSTNTATPNIGREYKMIQFFYYLRNKSETHYYYFFGKEHKILLFI
jgi:hypothetical protein